MSNYLIRIKKPHTYHLYNGQDTACKMLSTGGMNSKKYNATDNVTGLVICTMCHNVNKRGDAWKQS